MRPRVVQIDPQRIDLDAMRQAAEVINNRGLVAFPTETVYGLGANALDPRAVAGVFEAKKRPLDDPLIVHVADPEDLDRLAVDVPAIAEKLAEVFWPGPLTMVLKKTELVPDIVTTGLETVAIRMPSNSVAREFIKACGTPIAAPSANLFGRPSPTSASHVVEDLSGRVDIVLDGGETEIGIESTVIEFVEGDIVVLRPGGVDIEEIEKIAVRVIVADEAHRSGKTPGTYPQHYSPKARVVLVDNSSEQKDKVVAEVKEKEEHGLRTGILSVQEHAVDYRPFNVKVLGPADDGRTCATRLFRLLREFDSENVEVIIAESIPEKGMGRAVMNRLRKAAGPDLFS